MIYTKCLKAGSKEEQSSNASLLSQQLAEQFMKQFDMNVLLDDRGEKSIGWKLKQHKSIGIPCTVVLGKRLSEPTPLYEFSDNCDAQTKWITQAELFHKLRNKFV